ERHRVERAHGGFALRVGLRQVQGLNQGCHLNSPIHQFTNYALNTEAGSSFVTLLIETSAAPVHITTVRPSIPIANGSGSRIAAPPFALPRTTNQLTNIASE